MIVLDTHVWVQWVGDDRALAKAHREVIAENEAAEIGVSVISCWEVAMLVSSGRLDLSVPALGWIEKALEYPGVRLLGLTPSIVVDSTTLPGAVDRDPADRVLVATARAFQCPLLRRDARILEYPYVEKVGPIAR